MATEKDLVCNKVGCTLAQTGSCVLEHDPEQCQERIDSLKFVESVLKSVEPLATPIEPIARLATSYTLSTTQAQQFMAERYCRMIGVLGTPGTGKTACLVSFYLMMAHGRFNGFDFRDSKTIMAFEDICQGARTWNETNAPENLTTHTELPDERTAGFLHARLSQNDTGNCFDLLIPDLPGEWTDALINDNRTDRLSFLKSAEQIWLMVNGQEIQKAATKHTTLHRLTLLIQRLAAFLGEIKPTLVLVVTHKDEFSGIEPLLKKVLECAATNGFEIKVNEIASFSENDEVQAGDGISDMIVNLIKSDPIDERNFWPNLKQTSHPRQFMNFGKNSAHV